MSCTNRRNSGVRRCDLPHSLPSLGTHLFKARQAAAAARSFLTSRDRPGAAFASGSLGAKTC
eukprot:1084472-Pleurochrysis_carterae.AAC.1